MGNKIKFKKLNHCGEQIFHGVINVEEIERIKPHYAHTETLDITIVAHEETLKGIFLDIWAAVGDDILKEWVKPEGFELTEIAPLSTKD